MKKQIINFNSKDVLTVSPVEDMQYLVNFNDWKDKKSLVVNLETSGVSCAIFCGYKVLKDRVFDLSTTINHKAPSTSSKVDIRGVLYDGGVSKYTGSVTVEKQALGSFTRLSDKVLVTGNGIRNYSEPVLKIETNDVSASHASFTGRIDENQLYYLQSRGLTYEESKELLISAFLARSEV